MKAAVGELARITAQNGVILIETPVSRSEEELELLEQRKPTRRFHQLDSLHLLLRGSNRLHTLGSGNHIIVINFADQKVRVMGDKMWRHGLHLLVIVALLLSAVRVQAQANAEATVENILETLRNEGRYAEALTLLRQHLASLQAGNRLETPSGAAILNNYGELHYKLGLYAEAIPIYERAIAIADATIKADTPLTAIALRNLGAVYQLVNRRDEALRTYVRATTLFAKLPNQKVQAATTLNNIATLLQEGKRFQDAEKISQQVLKTYVEALGETHPYVVSALSNLGALYERMGDLAKAETFSRAAVEKANTIYSRDHPQLVPVLRNLGSVYARKKDWANALVTYRDAFRILRKNDARSGNVRAVETSGLSLSPSLQMNVAGDFVNTAMKVIIENQGQGHGDVDLVGEVFAAGQWRPSLTGSALQQLAVRAASGNGDLVNLIRTRQDLISTWQALSKRISDAIVNNSRAKEGLRTDITHLQTIDKSIVALESGLARDFPNYTALVSRQPLDLAATQNLLRDDEALVFFIETGGPSWIWVITKTGRNLSLLNMTPAFLSEQTALLRCGLDATNWANPATMPDGSPTEARQKREQTLVYERCKRAYPLGVGSASLPFDQSRAHGLYNAMFAPVQKDINGKHLIIVPSPSLLALPFNALITEATVPNTPFRDVKWLGTAQPISVLPTLSSLGVLRSGLSASKGTHVYAGFGNPLLDGQPGVAVYHALALQAREKKVCAFEKKEFTRHGRGRHAATANRVAASEAFVGNTTNIDLLMRQTPLPETADELCEVAELLSASSDDVFLGANATETRLKAMSAANSLSQYRILHFATHGLISGNLPGLSEPALIMTPPKVATDNDDGLLTASEISALKLDANWVVLSACNTASAGNESGEPFSGLTRAFIYAGARAVLVTHWEINSAAAVALTTYAFKAIQDEPAISQAEAMRRSMQQLIAKAADEDAAHPSVWAPFVLIGDGWRSRP